jgi:P27 family predicted phage terminase small subunit
LTSTPRIHAARLLQKGEYQNELLSNEYPSPPEWLGPQEAILFQKYLQARAPMDWHKAAEVDLLAQLCVYQVQVIELNRIIKENGYVYETQSGYMARDPHITVRFNLFQQIMTIHRQLRLSQVAETKGSRNLDATARDYHEIKTVNENPNLALLAVTRNQ